MGNGFIKEFVEKVQKSMPLEIPQSTKRQTPVQLLKGMFFQYIGQNRA